jgi:hypothetical protein
MLTEQSPAWLNVTVVDGVVALVAIYGAVLSTGNALREHRRDRTSLSIKAAYSYLQYGPQLSAPYLTIHVANNSAFDVMATSGGVELPPKRFSRNASSKQLYFQNDPELGVAGMSLPTTIKARHGAAFGQALGDIAASLQDAGYPVPGRILVRPFVTLSTGERIYGRKKSISVS